MFEYIIGDITYSHTYNDQGIRTSKTDGTETTTYFLDGSLVLFEKTGNDVIYYTYDADGSILSLNYLGDEYFYIKNLQGDIIEIVDASGNSVAKYRYDAWGNIVYQWDGGLGIANINPYRYRSYRLDSETGLYYLNARYYDPSIGRFISADSINYLDPSSGQGLNLYAYCGNNPVMHVDPSGEFAISLTIIGLIIGAIVGATAGGVIAYNVAKDQGAEGWDLAAWTGLGIMGGGLIGGAIGAGVGALVTHFTGITGLSITKYSIIPIKEITVLGHMPGYISAAGSSGAGYYLITENLYNSLTPAQQWANNVHYLNDAHSLGSHFAIVPDRVVVAGTTLWQEIQYLVEQGIAWIFG